MRLKRILAISLLGGAGMVGGADLQAQSWVAPYNRLVKQNKNKEALQFIWSRTLRNPSANEHVQRALRLQSLGMPLLSLREWADAIRKNPKLRVAMEGFGQVAVEWDRLGSVNSVVKAVNGAGVASRTWPPSFKLAASLNAMRRGARRAAARWLPTTRGIQGIQREAAKIQAALHLSGLQWALGNPRDAIRTLTVVAGNKTSSEYGVLRLQAARLNYDLNRFTPSLEQLVRLPRNSGSWYQGVLTGAWSAYRLRDYNLALGQLLTLHSPYLENKYGPETYILEASTLFQLCHFKSAKRSIDSLREKYKGFLNALARFQRTFSSTNARLNSVLAYAKGKYSLPTGVDGKSYALVMDGLLQEDTVLRSDRILAQIELEKKRLAQIVPARKTPLWRSLENVYKSEWNYARIEAYRDGTSGINRKLRMMKTDVEVAFENSKLVELEVDTQLRQRLITAEVPQAVEVDFDTEVRKGFEFWPFEGEYWRDEVGSYAFATSSVCGG